MTSTKRSFASDEGYQNFSDEAETGYLRAYYGTNLERLVEIKRKYDPDNLFRFAQSIPSRSNGRVRSCRVRSPRTSP